MSVIASIIEIAPAFIPAAGGWVAYKWASHTPKHMRIDPFEERKVDGRTETEWYELIRDNGQEYTEELMLGPLASKTTDSGEIELVRDDSVAWHPRKLMGNYYWERLQNEWYPFRNYPCETFDHHRGVMYSYSKPNDKGIMTIKAVKGKHRFETEILAEPETYKDLQAMAQDALWDKIRAEEKKEYDEIIKKKQAAKLAREEEWLKERVKRQRDKVIPKRNMPSVDELEALMRKSSKMLRDLERGYPKPPRERKISGDIYYRYDRGGDWLEW